MSGIATFIQTPMDDQGQFILTYNALLDDYPDLTPDLVKKIVGARSDCDKVIFFIFFVGSGLKATKQDALGDVIAACRGILPSEKQFKPFFLSIETRKKQI
jgi:hypothetical protein